MEEESMPYVILSVVIVMIILAVGTFAFFTTTTEIGYTSQQTQTFTVTDPTVANTFDLEYYPTGIVSVQQYNGFGWQTVDSAWYTTNQKAFTIQPGGMQG